MSIHSSPDYEPTPEETKRLSLESALFEGEGSETLTTFEDFETAKQALLEQFILTMNGEGESHEANIQYIQLLLDTASENYAYIAQMSEEREELIVCASQLLHRSLKELLQVVSSLELELETTPIPEVDSLIETMELALEDEDEEVFTTLMESFRSTYGYNIETLLPYAEDNVQDMEHMKRAVRIEAIKSGLKDTVKIALGATAALLVTRLIDKKR